MSDNQTEKFYHRLAERGGYSQLEIGFLRAKIEGLSSELRAVLEGWLQSGSLTEIVIEGYSMTDLMQRKGLEPVAAILTLDWLRREPDAARQAIENGHDDLK